MAEQPTKQLQAWVYVLVQAIILLLLVFMSDQLGPTISKAIIIGTVLEWTGGLGILLAAISIRTSLTALPLPKEHSRLSTSGLYRSVRHPMYTSVLILTIGIALQSGSIIKYGLVVALAILFYYKSVYEERYLAAKFPEYKSYAKKTPRLIPFIRV